MSSNTKNEVRIVLVSQYLAIGGLERVVMTLAESLTNSNVPVWIFYYDHSSTESPLVKDLQQKGVRVVAIKKSKGFCPKIFWELAKLIKKQNITCVHSHDTGPLLYGVFARLVLRLLSPFQKVIHVHTQHSFVHLGISWRYGLYERIFTRFVTSLVCVSEQLKTIYENKLGCRTPIRVVTNGVNFGPLPCQEQQSSRARALQSVLPEHWLFSRSEEWQSDSLDAVWIISVARVYSGKGQDTLMRLWSLLSPEVRASLRLIFVGSYSNDFFENCIKPLWTTLPDRERVLVAGPSYEPWVWLDASSLFISGSSFEGHPLSTLEALGRGCVLFLSDIEGHKTLEELALYFPLDDLNSAAGTLTSLVTNRQKLATFAQQNASNAAAVRHRWGSEGMCRTYLDIYQQREIPSKNRYEQQSQQP